MTTIINSCGSHWAGEDLSPISELITMLKNHPLRRDLESCGNFINPFPLCVRSLGYDPETGYSRYVENEEQPYRGLTSFFGNFFDWSFVFNIYTDDPELISALTKAIRKNQERSDYLDQEAPTPHHWITIRLDGTREIK